MTDTAALVARLEQVAARLESAVSRVAAGGAAAPAAAAAGGSGASSASLDGFDEVVTGPLATFLSASKAIGGEIATQAALVEKAFTAQRAFLAVAATSKQPDQATFGTLLADTSSAMQEIGNFRESNRKSAQFNQLSAVSEGIPALGWVTVTPKPAPYIKEMIAACQFYSNRVLKDFKESDPKQVDWAKAYVATLEALYEYVKRVHTTGLVWNANGGAASAAPKAAPAAAKPAAAPAAAAPAKPAGGGLFAELSKGEGVTSGLKKVDKSQMTHKNPELRASSVVKADDVKPKEPAKPAAGAAAAVKKPPVFELQGKKWVIENQENNRELVIEDCNLKQSVYIFKCNNSTIQIKGKINSISLDSCKKTAVVFNDCVASFESVNCQSIQVQVTGKVPTVSIDKTDGIQVYLGKDSLDTEIVTAKSSEMNIMVPGDVDGDFTEIPLPEQFKTIWDPKNKRFNTTTNEIAG